MAVEGIANLVQNLAEQLFGQTQGKPTGANTPETGNASNTAVTEDTFTPATQNNSARATAQDAGIFQVSQVALAAFTSNIRFGQTTFSLNQTGAPPQDATAATSDGDTLETAAQQDAATQASQAATGAAAGTTNVQDQLRALNAALPALGLTYAQIQQIDRIASLIQDFNPAAFADLVNQFEALAQQAAQQSAANAAANSGIPASPNTTASTNVNGGGGFQVQEILIHFTGSQESANNSAASSGGQSSTANDTQITAANLQIEQVQLVLANGNGQTLQVLAPQQNINAGTTDRQTHVAAA